MSNIFVYNYYMCNSALEKCLWKNPFLFLAFSGCLGALNSEFLRWTVSGCLAGAETGFLNLMVSSPLSWKLVGIQWWVGELGSATEKLLNLEGTYPEFQSGAEPSNSGSRDPSFILAFFRSSLVFRQSKPWRSAFNLSLITSLSWNLNIVQYTRIKVQLGYIHTYLFCELNIYCKLKGNAVKYFNLSLDKGWYTRSNGRIYFYSRSKNL